MNEFLSTKDLSIESLEKLMCDFGYVISEHLPLLRNVFHMMTGCVKEVHLGVYTDSTAVHRRPSFKSKDIKVLVYGIHNLYDEEWPFLKDYVVYPEALND